jgi:hypothetical protein
VSGLEGSLIETGTWTTERKKKKKKEHCLGERGIPFSAIKYLKDKRIIEKNTRRKNG